VPESSNVLRAVGDRKTSIIAFGAGSDGLVASRGTSLDFTPVGFMEASAG
jgi:hypothetical protein